MKQDYMVLARSKGTSPFWVIVKHGLKNCLIPVITYAGPLIANLVTGSFVIESLFSIPGLGGAFTTKAIAGGGVLIDWGVHFLDIVMYCCGDP